MKTDYNYLFKEYCFKFYLLAGELSAYVIDKSDEDNNTRP